MLSNDLIHCQQCKKTNNIYSEIIPIINGLYWIAADFSICKINKIKFIKKPKEAPITKKLNMKDAIIETKG